MVLLIHGSYGFYKGGFIGVDLFFVLSGYLITSLLRSEYQKTGKINFRNFYARRFLRLTPPLVLSVVLGNVLWNYMPRHSEYSRLLDSFAALSYTANLIWKAKIAPGFGHYWSLSIEEHFYLIFPVLASKLLFKVRALTSAKYLAYAIIAIVLFRTGIYHFTKIGYNFLYLNLIDIVSYTFTFCRIDSILVGVYLSFIISDKNEARFNKRSYKYILMFLLCIFFLLGFVLYLFSNYMYYGGFFGVDLLCGAIVFLAVQHPDAPFLSCKVCQYIGRRSYGIYLYHMPVFQVTENLRHNHSVSNLIMVTAVRFLLSGLVAELSYRFIEQPILLKYKKNFQS